MQYIGILRTMDYRTHLVSMIRLFFEVSSEQLEEFKKEAVPKKSAAVPR